MHRSLRLAAALSALVLVLIGLIAAPVHAHANQQPASVHRGRVAPSVDGRPTDGQRSLGRTATREWHQQDLAGAAGGAVTQASDYCGDASIMDTWSHVVYTAETGETLFVTRTCGPFSRTAWGPGGFTRFDISVGLDADGWDYALYFYDSGNGEIWIDAWRVVDNLNQATWWVTFEGIAQQPYEDEFGSYLPPDAIGDPNVFAFGAISVIGGNIVETVPEFGEFTLLHPNPCGGVASDLAKVRVSPADREATVARLEADGFATREGRAGEEWLLVSGDLGSRTLRDLNARPVGMWHPLVVPNDPLWVDQWGMEQVNAPAAWDRRTSSEGAVTIAIVDSGVDGSHSDLVGHVSGGWNAWFSRASLDRENNARGWHGTAVASIAAAPGNNGKFAAGVDWGANILPIEVLDPAGCATDITVAAGIRYAVDAGADVINLSLGGGEDPDGLVAAAMDHAAQDGTTVVVAAGNAGPTAPLTLPATHPHAVVVGALDHLGEVASYSQTGAGIDLVAPGGDGTDPSGLIMALGDNNTTVSAAGTSFAAPFVTGAASLWLSLHPGASAAELRAALTASVVDGGAPGHDPRFGHGSLDIAALVGPAATPPPTQPPPQPSPVETFDGDPADTQRIAAANATEAAVLLSRGRFADAASEGDSRPRAAWAVLSRDDVFADSLGGSALSTSGPLLFTRPESLTAATAGELERILAPGAGVFLLGGTAAISQGVADELAARGFSPIRLAGASRVETALAVADEVRRRYGTNTSVLLARADEWADSVTGGAYAQRTHTPVLVTSGAALHPAVAAWLNLDGTQRTIVLGGSAALAETIVQAVPGAERVAGPDRAATAVEIAATLLGVDAAGERAYTVIDGDRVDGWAYGLASAGLAGDEAAPIVMVRSGAVPDSTAEAVSSCDEPAVDLLVIGDESVISATAMAALDALDPHAC